MDRDHLGLGHGRVRGRLHRGRLQRCPINPAVSAGLDIADKFEWAKVPAYIAAQFLGAFIGAFLAWLFYRPHYAITEDNDLKLATF